MNQDANRSQLKESNYCITLGSIEQSAFGENYVAFLAS